MFTGIVQGLAKVESVTERDQQRSFVFRFPDNALQNVTTGASIAINGTCLTVTGFENNCAGFDAIDETLKLTNLGELAPGDNVNFERAAQYGDEIGGHVMSGHISDTVRVSDIIKTETNCRIDFDVAPQWLKYITPKGFVGLNGCSLTVGSITESGFCVHLIPETLAVTTFGQCRTGTRINLEIDPQTQAIVDTVERILPGILSNNS